jgi:hypothetical protein
LPIGDRYDIYFSCWLSARHTQARIASVNSYPPALQLSCSADIAIAPLDLPTLILEQTGRTPCHAPA